MLSEYIHSAIDRLSQRKPIDNLQALVTTKEGLLGLSAAILLIAVTNRVKATSIDRGCPQLVGDGWFGSATEEYRADPKAFVLKYQKKLGPVYGAKLFGRYVTVVSGSYVREVFLDDKFSFILAVTKTFDPNLMTNSGSSSSKTATYASDVIKRFLSPKLKQYTPRVIEHLKIAIDEQCGTVPEEGLVFDHAYPFLQHMVAKASASVFVGPKLAANPELIDSFKNMVMNIASELKPRPWLENFPLIVRFGMWYIGKTSPAVKRHRAQLGNALRPEVDRRLKAMASGDSNWERPDDMLQDILENYEKPEELDMITYLINWMTQLIFAALHTTSENGTVVMYRLLQHPHVFEELYEEQNEVLASCGYDETAGPEVFTREMLNKFVKLDSAVREACRVKNEYIVLPHANASDKPLTLSNGAVVLPGEFVYVNQFHNHRDPELQGTADDLYEFNPYRFLDRDKNSTKIGEDFTFFGMGKHACPGRWFAIQEIKTMMSMLIRSYKIEPVGPPIQWPTAERVAFPNAKFKLTPRKRVV
ncbi:cytochrome P450 [Gongronella butleri]|nr:cytochrome P450 [Gongronella butleri]